MSYQKVIHIAAGQFKTGKEQTDILQAYLGTCLGIALFDHVKKIGGMIHILLPEPVSTSSQFPEKYASTAIPMILKELTDLGSYRENLSATIAGGALVGPLSRQDINLDIGGRSTEIAVNMLKAAGIQTIKSETGGFFTCTLELDMSTGKTLIKPAWEDTESETNLTAPSQDDIVATIDHLKPIPQTALKILRMFQSSQHHIEDIARELARDQVLSAQTLKLCNSALFGGLIKIDTLKEASILLGESMLINSVIAAAVDNYFNQSGSSGYSLCKGGLFFHAIGVAATAEKIAEKAGSESAKKAYTAGLLHDIGKIILDQFVADRAPLFFRKLTQDNSSFLNAEKKLLGINHCEAGVLLAKKWQFSDGLTEVIKLHHTPEKATKDKDLVYTVYLADLLMEKFNGGFDLEKIQTKSLEKALHHLGFSMADLPELVDIIPLNAINNNDTVSDTKVEK
jgi:putative nucleotidyltransferase with HDIG domain